MGYGVRCTPPDGELKRHLVELAVISSKVWWAGEPGLPVSTPPS